MHLGAAVGDSEVTFFVPSQQISSNKSINVGKRFKSLLTDAQQRAGWASHSLAHSSTGELSFYTELVWCYLQMKHVYEIVSVLVTVRMIMYNFRSVCGLKEMPIKNKYIYHTATVDICISLKKN